MTAIPRQSLSKVVYEEPPDVPRTQDEIENLERWEFLVRLVGEEGLRASALGPDVSSWPPLANREGALAVIGSGIKAVYDFTSEAISLIKFIMLVKYSIVLRTRFLKCI